MVLEYRKTDFPGRHCLKKRLKNGHFFDKKHELNPLEKSQIFDYFNFLLLQPRNVFYCSVISYNTSSWPKFSKKKWKNGHFFGQNHGLTPLKKISIFRLFEILVFIAQKGVLSFYNMVKQIFLAYIAQIRNMKKWRLFGQNHRLIPLEKSQFFDF